jgi:hypothetical protein
MTGRFIQLFFFLAAIFLGTTTVNAQSYSITSITPMTFGDVMPGTTAVINPASAQAAVISITRSTAGNATSNLNIALPVSFSSGSNSIPITINRNDVQLIIQNGSAINPATLPNVTFELGGGQNRTLQVRIGGSVTIPVNTIPGLYTGTFTISISNTAL